MPSFSASAPGKAILFGEHGVVDYRPAIAVPIMEVRVRAVVSAAPLSAPGSVEILAPDIGLHAWLADLPGDQPLAALVQLVLSALQVARLPACQIRISSTIPVAAGLGSGAAVSVALLKALSAFLGHPLTDERVSALAFEVEKLHHGTPSGIDNTVITYALPVFFQREQPTQTLQVGAPFTIVIADTGIPSPTAIAVGDVQRAWQADPGVFELHFNAIGEIVLSARQALENGNPAALGPLMDANQNILEQMGVSSPELENLIAAARAAGALGAKLSGGGRGGNMIALVDQAKRDEVRHALVEAGARRTIVTTIGRTHLR